MNRPMPYPPRLLQPTEIYFITSRTIDGTLFLRPSPAINNAIGSILADAQERYGVEVFDYVFMSNHLHLAARSAEGRLPAFMQYLKANIAIKANRILGRRGPLWERRYTASPILDLGAQLERATYIYGHGPKEGLVSRAEEWPGVNSLDERLRDSPRVFKRLDQSGLTRHRFNRKEPPDEADYQRPVSVRLSPWPFEADLPANSRRQQTVALTEHARVKSQTVRGRREVLGVKAVLAQSPLARPKHELERKPVPLCHASSSRQRHDYAASLTYSRADYNEASERFRDGDVLVQFPPDAFRPPLPLRWSPRAGP